MKELLADTAAGCRYVTESDRRVAPSAEDVARLDALGGPLPEGPSDPANFSPCSTTSARPRRSQPRAAATSDS